MTQVVLVAHAPLASAFMAVARHVYPECTPSLSALDVEPDADPAVTEARLRAMLQEHATEGVLLIADTFGATPCNVAQRVADGARVRVVSGLNVPMLWRALCYRSEPVEDLVTRATSGGSQGIMPVGSHRPQNQNPVAARAANDQESDHRQQ